MKTIRDNVTSDDSSSPDITTGFAGMQYHEEALVEITLGGTNPSWRITPLYLNSEEDGYAEGESETITGVGTFIRKIDVLKTKNFNFKVDNSAGTSPSITVKAKGI